MGKLLKFRNEEGRLLPKNAGILNFIEDVFAFALILVLTVSAITIKIMQDNLHMQVLNADAILVNFGFVFENVVNGGILLIVSHAVRQ